MDQQEACKEFIKALEWDFDGKQTMYSSGIIEIEGVKLNVLVERVD